ncbi:hypothetical protein [Bifidobacterium santillanense]|uniref:hypothetical protein n=1 Tax=Bifidobacterium santillanense TaxID=2809028 RepID=UPI001F0A061E|nr:hypothetical protein [Bifidobacterium santillanense]
MAGTALSFAVFAALTGVSVRLMLSSGSKVDGLAALAGMGPSIAVTGVVVTTVGGLVSTGVFRLILGPVVPERFWPSSLSVSLMLCLPVALMLTARMLIAASLCMIFDSIGEGATVYIVLYYLPPIVVANLPDLRMLHEWLPSIAGTAIVESQSDISPMLSGVIALAYVVIAVVLAAASLNRRDVG